MGCASGIVKYLLFLVNFVFTLAGLAMLILGILYKLNFNDFSSELTDRLKLAPTLLIVIGAIVFLIAFFGCCGAVRESTCMLTTYAVILLTIFILQVAVGVFTFLQINNEDDLRVELKQNLKKTFSRYGEDPVLTETVDVIQQQFKCCGLQSPAEMIRLNGTVPDSCCEGNKGPCFPLVKSYTEGCFDKFFDGVLKAIKVIGIVTISLAATEVIGAVFALCLSSSIRNQYRRGQYA